MASHPPLTERRTLLVATLLGIAAVVALLLGHQRPTTPEPADLTTPAGAAVAALTGSHPMTALTALGDPERVLGYRPTTVDGHPANPHGGCSSPVPMPGRFEPLCRVHDLGYDLLRAAARSGHPLGPWARLRIDASLVASMERSCGDPLCRAAAETARVALAVNTWRQRDGVPVVESTRTIATSVVDRLIVAVAP
ncbi:hypothetical protein [Williamsia deligens]|uniref:Phospholipase A2 n=1 Tax=Williamsia deligens TaxID=321325 RepID=A0ABW3G1U6_9NOCA|nr:hypothetical protein [Williamsia deligens]MCP2195043.1 hypothetical protein [Williamsia deligens]